MPPLQSYPFLLTPFLFTLSILHPVPPCVSLSPLSFLSMASTLSVFNPTGIRASAVSGPRKLDQNRRRASQPTWWSPIFGWSSDPDYIVGESAEKSAGALEGKDSETARSRSRFTLGCFTEEKAKQLRRKTMESASFHDIMYHSSIASRLASDVPEL